MPRDLLLLAAAMALTNSASLHYGSLALNVGFISGDLGKAADAAVDESAPGPARQQRSMVLAVAALWTCYALGAAAGALAQVTLRLPLLPAAMLLPLSLMLPWERLPPAGRKQG